MQHISTVRSVALVDQRTTKIPMRKTIINPENEFLPLRRQSHSGNNVTPRREAFQTATTCSCQPPSCKKIWPMSMTRAGSNTFVFGCRPHFQFNRKRCQNQVFQKSISEKLSLNPENEFIPLRRQSHSGNIVTPRKQGFNTATTFSCQPPACKKSGRCR